MSQQASLPAAGGLLSLNLSMMPQGAQSAAAGSAGLFTGFSTMLSQQGGVAGQSVEFANGDFLPPQAAALPSQAGEQLSEQELFNQRLMQMAQLLEQQHAGMDGEIPEQISSELARALRQYTEQQPVLTPLAEGETEPVEASEISVPTDGVTEVVGEQAALMAHAEQADAEQAELVAGAAEPDSDQGDNEVLPSTEADLASQSVDDALVSPATVISASTEQSVAAAAVAAEQARLNARAAEVARQGEKVPAPLQGDTVKQVPAAEHSAAVQIHSGSADEGDNNPSGKVLPDQPGQVVASTVSQSAKQSQGGQPVSAGTTSPSTEQPVNTKPMPSSVVAQQPVSDVEPESVAKPDSTVTRSVTQLADQTVARSVQGSTEAEVETEAQLQRPVELKTPQKFEAALDMTKQLLQKMSAGEKSDSAASSMLDKPTAAVTAAGQSIAQPSQAQKVVTEAQNLMMPQQVRMNTPAWNNALGERAVMIATQNSRVAEIQLDPPELGSLSVRVNVNQDQVSLSFSSPHAHVRDAVEQSLPRLREMFAEQGLALQDSSVSDHSSEQQSREQMAGDRGTGGQYAEGGVAGSSEESAAAKARPVSLVDYYA